MSKTCNFAAEKGQLLYYYHIMKKFLFILAPIVLAACHKSNYVLLSVKPQRIEVTKALDARPVAEAQAFLARYCIGVDSLEKPRVGQSQLYMPASRPESLLSNWVADVLVATGVKLGYKPDLGLCNIGGLRAAMPQGVVRRGDIISIAPFENFFTILRLRGNDVIELMSDIAKQHGEGVSSGARLVITRDGRLRSATIGGKPIDPDSIYTIATLDYLAEGNDNLNALKKSVERLDTRTPVRDALMDYLRNLDAQGLSATAAIEGRIIESDEGEAPQAVRQTEIGSREQAEINIRSISKGDREVKDLLILHTNDSHSCIMPLNPNLSDTAQADKGGYLRRAALIRDLRESNPDLLLFDCGDFSQGSPFYSLYRGDVEVGLMNIMGYDAATIGNHEFDFGLENMARIFRMAKFPMVCCNYDFTGTPVEGLVHPFVVIERNGLRVGVTGVSPELKGLVAEHTCAGVVYNDPIKSLQAVVNRLRGKERCDLVICLSHLGWQVKGCSDEELIPSTKGVDVVLGGHSHTYFASPQVLQNLNGTSVPDNQMGKNARYVGTLRLKVAK